MSSVGIHALPGKCLGLRPPKPGLPRLRLGDFLTGVVPDHPSEADYLAGITFGLYANDTFGDCGPVSVANDRRLITARLSGTMAAPSQTDVFDLYRRSGNPGFNPNLPATDPRQDDNGVSMQEMLGQVLSGGIGGVKCLGFASVDVSNLDELDAAVGIFGSLLLGVNLETAQQAQTDRGIWDYSPSGVWGGHAVLDGAYLAAGGHKVITWAKTVLMTDAFARHQESEAWVVIWPEHLKDDAFIKGVNLSKFAAAFTAITGKPFPAVVPPPPGPGPGPTPPPTPGGMSLSQYTAIAHKVRDDNIAKNPGFHFVNLPKVITTYQDRLDAAIQAAFGK